MQHLEARKPVFFPLHNPFSKKGTEVAPTPEESRHARWIKLCDSKIDEAEKKNLYPRFRTHDNTAVTTFYEIRKLSSGVFVVSETFSVNNIPDPKHAIVVDSSTSVHLLDRVLEPGSQPTLRWITRNNANTNLLLNTSRKILDSARIFDPRKDGQWPASFQPTTEILAGIHPSTQ